MTVITVKLYTHVDISQTELSMTLYAHTPTLVRSTMAPAHIEYYRLLYCMAREIDALCCAMRYRACYVSILSAASHYDLSKTCGFFC
jgi:hypothetical protein